MNTDTSKEGPMSTNTNLGTATDTRETAGVPGNLAGHHTSTAREIEHLHRVAREAALIGGREAMRWFRSRSLPVEQKADDTPVTQADRNAEREIRRFLRHCTPDATFLGEEEGGSLATHGDQWIIDPIDGTKSFVRGVPLFTTLVALARDGVPVTGVIYAPATGEMVSATLGGGAWDEDMRPVHVDSCTTLKDSWYGTTDFAELYRRYPQFSVAMLEQCRETRTWADAYGYMLVARGAMHVMVDPILSPWDAGPLALVMREARGVCTDFSGVSGDILESIIAASTAELHAQVMEILQRFPCAGTKPS